MVIALIAGASALILALLGLVGFAISRLSKLAENALVLGRAKDAGEYASALDALEAGRASRLAKDMPKPENEEDPDLLQLPDGRLVRRLVPGEPL